MPQDPYEKVKEDILRDMSVTAGAGAGKTTSLKDRYVNIITKAESEGVNEYKLVMKRAYVFIRS